MNRLAAGCLLACAFASAGTAAQEIAEEEDLLDRVRDMRVVLNMGAVAFEELDFARSVRDLSRILDPYSSGRLEPRSSEEIGVLAGALEFRGRAFFNLGQTDRTDQDFARLIRLDVRYRLDRERISPKVIARWDAVRAGIVGILTVHVEPIGAELFVDDQVAELGPHLEKDLLAGSHRIRISKEGFAPFETNVEVIADEVVRVTAALERNARDVRFFTIPSGVEVVVDGISLGVTSGMGIDRARISAPFLVPNLSPGPHKIHFAKDCFAASTARIEVVLDREGDAVQDFRPVVLEPSQADLAIRTTAGGSIRMDGKEMGEAPRQMTQLCAGPRWIEVRLENGLRWFDRIDLQAGTSREVNADPRLTLVYLGIYSRQRDGTVEVAAKGGLAADLRETGGFNLILPSEASSYRSEQTAAFIQSRVAETLSRADPEIWNRAGPIGAPVLKRAREELGADLLLLGTRSSGGAGEEMNLFLYETGLPAPDRITLTGKGEGKQIKAFLTQLAGTRDLFTTWFGATTAGVSTQEGLVVLRVTEGGPAAAAGIRPGDEISAVDDRPIGTHREWIQRLRDARPGDSLRLRVEREGKSLDLSVRLARTPRLLPGNRPDLLYTKMIAEFRLRARTAAAAAEKNLLRLNLALAYLRFGEFEKAIEDGFRQAQLARGAGISFGTVQYYLGVSYRNLGNQSRAREALRRAAAESDATLETHDGPLVSLRAARLLKDFP